MVSVNPFFHRGPIRDPSFFFGRENETRQILSLVGNGQSVSLVGQRRIGKTSLLFHISNPQISVQYGLNAQKYLFVYIDCSGWSRLPPAECYQFLLEEIEDTLLNHNGPAGPSSIVETPQPVTYRRFERSIRRLTRRGYHLILVLDEFERLSQNPKLDPGFFSGLRALTVSHSVAYITASKDPLLKLTYANASALSSPFFNIFASIRLGLLSEDESRQLLVELAAKSGIILPGPLINHLLTLAGPHPLFLQNAGFQGIDLLQVKNSDLSTLDRRFSSSVEEHFKYYWRNLSPAAKRLLVVLPALQASQVELLRELEQACLIRRADDQYDYLSSAWRSFVQTQPVVGLTQAGPIAIDESLRQAFLDGHLLSLSPTQYDLLCCLISQPGQVVSPEQLEHAIWGETYVDDPERLKSVIKGLRKTLGNAADRLENVRGVGYLWRN